MFAKLQSRLIFLSLFIASTAFSMENPISGDKSEKKTVIRKVFHMPPKVDIPVDQKEKDNDKEDKEGFDQDTINNMNQVFNNAPKQAQNIVKHLKNPNFLHDGSYRATIFYGIPGSGKTMLAKAIAYRMKEAGWKYALISSTSLLQEYRNQTAIYLNRIFNAIIAKNEPFLLIIDELNQLLENADSKHHDSDATSKAIWSFLDSRRNKHNFFFIGTMNRLNKLPQPFKSRILFKCIEFGPLVDIVKKNEIFRRKLQDGYAQLDQGVTDDDLNIELNKIKDCTGRDLEEFVSALKIVYRNYDDDENNNMVIAKKHIEEVIATYLKTYSFMEYNKIEETEEERSERHYQGNLNNNNTHHRENTENQNRLHQENLRLQAENKAMQELHFLIQQQKQDRNHIESLFKDFINAHNYNVYGNSIIESLPNLQTFNGLLGINSPLSVSDKEKLIRLCSYLTDDQIKLFESMMANMLAQRTKLMVMSGQAQESCIIQ